MVPPYVQNTFNSCHFVMTEMEVISAIVNAIVSFNPDLIVEYEVCIQIHSHFVDTTRFFRILD